MLATCTKGMCLERRKKRMTAQANKSVASPLYGYCRMISGAKKQGDPTIDKFAPSTCFPDRGVEKPKSTILISKFWSSIMLEGFRSRWA